MIFSLPELVITILLDLIVLVLSTLAFFLSIVIIKNWDFDSTSSKQYHLEKLVYLAAILIIFVLTIKLILLPFFVFLLDRLSPLLAGAMCAAGVVSANSYGEPLLFIRIVVALMLAIWLVIHHQDLQTKNWQFTKKKFIIFVPIFFLILAEFILEILYLSHIDTTKAVACCSLLYGSNKSIDSSSISSSFIVITFVIFAILTILSNIYRYASSALISATIFTIISLYMITYYISPYIYELPTHQCPYCILQKEYYYTGYVLYISLFAGLFLQISASISSLWLKKEPIKLYKLAIFCFVVFLLLSLFYPLFYFIKNGVWL